MTDLTLRGKGIDLNNFNGDIMSDTIGESRIDYEDTKYGKAELNNPKEFSHHKWT